MHVHEYSMLEFIHLFMAVCIYVISCLRCYVDWFGCW